MRVSLHASNSKQRDLLEDSARWRLISVLFECPADGWDKALIALASAIPDPDLKESAAAAQAEASEGSYHSLFGPGGPASPREVSYRKRVELGSLMSELAGYYDAFGYQPASMESFDHVAIETGYIAYLRLKEAYTHACGDSEHAEVTANAAEHFIRDHVSVMAEPFAKLVDQSGIRYLSLAARALVQNTVHNGKQ